MRKVVLLLVACLSQTTNARRSLNRATVSIDPADLAVVARKWEPESSKNFASLLLALGPASRLTAISRARSSAKSRMRGFSSRSGSPVLSGTVHEITSNLIAAASAGGFSSTADDLAGSFFGISLFPWLAMLYLMKHPTVKAPPGVTFGLTYLLAFVFGSIPAAIGAGVMYGASLADADWLHGAAESLLAVTNCVVVLGFRDGLSSQTVPQEKEDRLRLAANIFGVFAILSAIVPWLSMAGAHTPWLGGVGNLPADLYASEPANALSLPTWIIHTSSLVEWLVAMGLAWRYAEVSNQPKWKGVTWGMLPLHTSGIIACTYHLFYNAPAISWCVTLQAFMTCVGNTTLMLAALRLALAQGWTWDTGKEDAKRFLEAVLNSMNAEDKDSLSVAQTEGGTTDEAVNSGGDSRTSSTNSAESNSALVGWEDLGDAWSKDSNLFFLLKLAALSGGLAYFVKYSPALLPQLLVDTWGGLPDEVISAFALAVIVLPTGLNVAKWQQRSKEGAEFVGDI